MYRTESTSWAAEQFNAVYTNRTMLIAAQACGYAVLSEDKMTRVNRVKPHGQFTFVFNNISLFMTNVIKRLIVYWQSSCIP